MEPSSKQFGSVKTRPRDQKLASKLRMQHARSEKVVLSSKQRVLQLTKDHDIVRRTLVSDSVLATHYGKGIHCAHVEDGAGARETTEGILLIPVADDVMAGCDQATAVKSGMFTNVPISNSYVSVNKKVAMQAKRAMFDWK